jgi:Mg2+ and Co2+ transporter CorA
MKLRQLQTDTNNTYPTLLTLLFSPRIFECLVGMGLEEVVGRFEGVKSDVYKILGELGDMRTSVGGGKSAKFGFLSTQRKVTELLPLKNKLDSLEGILTDIYNTFMELLQDESDMGLIAGCLGDCKKEHVELMLEDTLQQAEEIRQSVRDVQAYVKNSEEIMEIELSLIRNRIMRFELLLEITGLMVACGAAVTGLFGMNLVSHLEDSWWVFYGTTGFIIVLMSGIFKGLIEQCRADNIL